MKRAFLFLATAVFLACGLLIPIQKPVMASPDSYMANGCMNITQEYGHYRFTNLCNTRLHITVTQPNGYFDTLTVQPGQWVESGYTTDAVKAWACTGYDPGWAINPNDNDTSPTYYTTYAVCSGS